MTAWGNPWRGKIQGGTIQLPAGPAKVSEQPQGALARHYDEPGYTYLQRGPLAGVTRTPDELAADALAGRTWRADAILGGSRMHLYGKRLDGWVYCAVDGSRWHVPANTLRLTLQTNQPLSISMTLTRFGDFGQPPVEQALTLALADLGQAEPDPAWPVGTQAYAMVCDIRPDGSRALLMLYQPVVPIAQRYGWHPLHKRPLGWLEVQLSGGMAGITATLSVVRTRAQAFGAGTWTIAHTAPVQRWVNDDTLVVVDKGDYYEYTSTPNALSATVGDMGWTWHEGGGPSTQSFGGRILALWYLPDGEFEEVTLDLSVTSTSSNPSPTETVSGSQVQHVYKDSSPTVTITDDRVHTLGRACTCTEAVTIRLSRGGVLVDEVVGSAEVSLQQERRFIVYSQPFYSTRTDTVTLDSVTGSKTQGGETSGPVLALGSLEAIWLASAVPGNSPAHAAFRSSDMSLFSPGGMMTINPVRYSNNLVALRRYINRYADNSEIWQHGPAAYPGGAHAGLVAVSEFLIFGSYNPATGEVVRDQATPVCWV